MSYRFQRLLLIFITLSMIMSAVLLILYNTKENISYFYTPSEIVDNKFNNYKKIRIGGFVQKDTFIKSSPSLFEFKITDNVSSIKVKYSGILPDLFREGQGTVIEGKFDSQKIFQATSVFAKHDENYMPLSLKKDLEDKGYWKKDY